MLCEQSKLRQNFLATKNPQQIYSIYTIFGLVDLRTNRTSYKLISLYNEPSRHVKISRQFTGKWCYFFKCNVDSSDLKLCRSIRNMCFSTGQHKLGMEPWTRLAYVTNQQVNTHTFDKKHKNPQNTVHRHVLLNLLLYFTLSTVTCTTD